jgi:teichuronic acid biosynthesis protein TuaE
MWNSSSIRKISIFDTLFLIAVLLGPAASYSNLYFFHLILFVLFLKSATSIWGRHQIFVPRALRWDVVFFLFFLGWYGLSILWAQDKPYAVQYCVYVGLGILTVYYTAAICRTLERLQAALWVVMGTISLQIVLAVTEGMRLIRLPFSPYSPYRWVFGREPMSFEGLSQSQVDQVLSMPTGFAGNPNNLAAFLVLVLPLFLFARRWLVAVLGAAAIYFVIDMANARAGIIGFWVVMVLGFVLYSGHRIRTVAASVSVAAAMVVGGGLPVYQFLPAEQEVFPPGSEEVLDTKEQDASSWFSNLTGNYDAAARLSQGILSGDTTGSDSVGLRIQLILNGLDALRESYGLGVGAGGSLTVQKHATSERIGDIGSMHNFWVELLVDGGVLFAALFFAWSCWLVWRLWCIGCAPREPVLKYLGEALSLGLLGFFFSAIGPSSVIYMLPMWMVIGLALSVVRLSAQEITVSKSSSSVVSAAGAAE